MIKFGFTRKESGVLLFLIAAFITGTGIQTYRRYWAPLPVIVDDEYSSEVKTSVDSIQQKWVPGSSDIKEPGCIFLNLAGQEELEKLPGIGPVTAGRILQYRSQYGSFKTIDEILKVQGVGKKTLEKIKPYLKLNN